MTDTGYTPNADMVIDDLLAQIANQAKELAFTRTQFRELSAAVNREKAEKANRVAQEGPASKPKGKSKPKTEEK